MSGIQMHTSTCVKYMHDCVRYLNYAMLINT